MENQKTGKLYMMLFKAITRNILAILGGVILLFLLWYFNKIVAYILLSFIVSLIGQPLVRILSKLKIKKFHLPLSICSLITLLLFWAIFLGFFSFFIPLLVREFQSLSKINVQPILASIDAPFRQFLKFTAQNPADIDRSVHCYRLHKLSH